MAYRIASVDPFFGNHTNIGDANYNVGTPRYTEAQPNWTTAPFTTPYELVWKPEVVFRVTTIIVVMVMTFLGNTALICGIVCNGKLRRKRVNIFLLNLAIGDLMVCFVTMTTEILFVAFGEWVLGAAACKIIVYGQIVTLASTTSLLTGMSIDRYQVIVQPFKSLTGQPKIWRKVLIAWTLALIFAIPQLFIFVQTDEGTHPDGRIKHMCKSKGYTQQWQRKLYFTLMTIYILIVPTIIMTFCYVKIIQVVWMRTSSGDNRQPKLRFVSSFSRSKSFSNGDSIKCMRQRVSRAGSDVGNDLHIPHNLVSSSKRNVVKMTLSVIIGFVVCWTPYFVVSLIRIYSDYEIQIRQALSVAEIMALVHSALNPILYGIFSTRMVKRACVDMCRKCRRKETGTGMDFVISDDDSSYWREAKLQRQRLATVKPPPNSQESSTSSGTTKSISSFCSSVMNRSCCASDSTKDPSPPRPMLIYRKAAANNNKGGQSNKQAFRMRPVGASSANATRSTRILQVNSGPKTVVAAAAAPKMTSAAQGSVNTNAEVPQTPLHTTGDENPTTPRTATTEGSCAVSGTANSSSAVAACGGVGQSLKDHNQSLSQPEGIIAAKQETIYVP